MVAGYRYQITARASNVRGDFEERKINVTKAEDQAVNYFEFLNNCLLNVDYVVVNIKIKEYFFQNLVISFLQS